MKKKQSKERKPKFNFAQKLAMKLEEFGKGKVEYSVWDDKSGSWVEMKTPDGMTLAFSFDIKGEKIDRIGLYKDIVEVVDTKLIWGN